ncbi:Extra-large guanine nucleotide-binding protein 1 [Striga hermonthica]|uniref:Extra-large guanine nucleotide-binding protein 1 n=1 Tax=Striga hermonthica TaxID=68872 RepID=A0A9N7NHH7_STRHE|nr:Extra-large guanine nucleotide-binding protein 1 [Striga hermonthica]
MTSELRSSLPGSSSRSADYDDDYSFAIEYTGPPVSRDIPKLVPIDIRHIPTASMADNSLVPNNFPLPVIQPIVKNDPSSKKTSRELNSGGGNPASRDSGGHFGKFACLARVHPGTSSSESPQEPIVLLSSSSNTCCDESLDYRESGDDSEEDSVLELDDDGVYDQKGPEIRPVAANGSVKKGSCHKCGKTSRLSGKEVCVVCGAKYCRKCVLRAMGCMPEGRKCITCIGHCIDESRRRSLGKCSRMLRKLLGDDVARRVMSDEVSCEANQLPPRLVFVNDKPLSVKELVGLQSCGNPPKKLRPGRYWYDKVSGFWGKEGEKPSQIISPQLALGFQIRRDASNGDTNVMVNNREITKHELWMLQAAGINCEGSPHFWVTADGCCQHEGMKNVLGKLWERKRVKILCAALSLPFPSDTSDRDNGDVDEDTEKVIRKIPDNKTMYKLLLVGCDQSGTSTIFKQAKIAYNVPFSDDQKQSIKFLIQRNIYLYLCILLEGHARFEEEYTSEMRRKRAEEPGPSDYAEQVEESNIYSFSPRLKAFAEWLLQVTMSGNLEIIFPAATREYSPLVEELWKDKAFQATYKRRNELHTLPRVANYFLDRAVEISRVDYEPSQMDILYAEGITSSNGVATMEFSFPELPQDGYMEPSNITTHPTSYQLIRVHSNSLGENCKWLPMFEQTDLVIYCVSLTEYDEYHESLLSGARTNKMLTARNLFQAMITHPTLAHKEFLLVLNKFDLLEEKVDKAPLSLCEWFRDFNPVISHHHGSSTGGSSSSPSMAQRAFHYVAVKFKRLFKSLTGRKLFVSRATGLESSSVDEALKYCREILKWSEENHRVSFNNEWSSESMEPTTSV